MANRLDSAMDGLATALETALIDEGPLARVERRPLLPAEAGDLPALGLVMDRFRRHTGNEWIASLVIMILARQGADEADATVTDLVAEADSAIATHADGGSAGCVLDAPDWQAWYSAHGAGELRLVGALGSMTMRVAHPLKTD